MSQWTKVVAVCGNGSSGQLGLGLQCLKGIQSFRILAPLAVQDAKQVACGGAHTCYTVLTVCTRPIAGGVASHGALDVLCCRLVGRVQAQCSCLLSSLLSYPFAGLPCACIAVECCVADLSGVCKRPRMCTGGRRFVFFSVFSCCGTPLSTCCTALWASQQLSAHKPPPMPSS